MKSSQETCCTETVIFGGKICTAGVLYRGYSETAEYVRILVSSKSHNSFTQWNRGGSFFCASTETSRFALVSVSHACMSEHLQVQIYLARAKHRN